MKKKVKKKDKKFSFFKKKKSNRFLNVFKKKETFNSLEVTIIILLSFIIGFVLALIFVFAKDRYLDKSDEPLNEIINTYNSILEEYYDKVSPEDLSKAAVSGMVNSLDDPYSYYMDKETSDDFNESLEGTYEGIGLVITRYDQDVEVVKVVKNLGIVIDSPFLKKKFSGIVSDLKRLKILMILILLIDVEKKKRLYL